MLKNISPSKICADYLLLHADIQYKELDSESYEDLYGDFSQENFIQFILKRAEKLKEEIINSVTKRHSY